MVWLGLDTKPTWLGKDDSSVQNTCIGHCYDPGLGETLAQQENEIPALPVPQAPPAATFSLNSCIQKHSVYTITQCW